MNYLKNWDLLGNKAKRLKEIVLTGIPVPLFTTNLDLVGPEAIRDVDLVHDRVCKFFGNMHGITSRISVRSSGVNSMPGVLHTDLHVNWKNLKEFSIAYERVLKSYDSRMAEMYRRRKGFTREEHPCVIFQEMVGCAGDSYHGAMTTWNPSTGMESPMVSLSDSHADIVGGKRELTTVDARFAYQMESVNKYAKYLEEYFEYPQDVEFVVDESHAWILQTRDMVFDQKSSVRAHAEMLRRGNITRESAQERCRKPTHESLLHVSDGILHCTGIPAVSGVAVGELFREGSVLRDAQAYVLLNESLEVNESILDERCKGIITLQGNSMCHAAIIARERGVPCVHGPFTSDPSTEVGLAVTVDGSTGSIYKGVAGVEADRESLRDVEEVFGNTQ